MRDYQLMNLANRFELNAELGNEAWKLFLPCVTFEAFETALRKASYGGYAKDESSGRRGAASFTIPQLDRFILKCPATLQEYDQTVDITKRTFHHDLIELEADRRAFIRNPYSMVVLLDSQSGQILGWVDIYHLPNDDFERMIRDGEVRVDPSRVLDFPGSCNAKRGYTASIVIDPIEKRRLARLLVYGMMEFLLEFQFQGTEEFEIFAVGETKEGTQLLETLGFTLLRSVDMEAGPRGLYSRKLSKQELEREQRNFWRRYDIDRTDIRLEIERPEHQPD